jgi:PhnB protein
MKHNFFSLSFLLVLLYLCSCNIIDGIIFHIHDAAKPYHFSSDKHRGTTCISGLFVPDVRAVMSNAIQAGAKEISHAKDYEYGYHQGEIEYPFGHHWLIQRKIL